MPRRFDYVLATTVMIMLIATPGAACQTDPIRVAIDIGHFEGAPGAISATGKTEYEFNTRFADELMARSQEFPKLHLLRLQPSPSLGARPRAADKRGAHVFISIHHDSVNRKYIQLWKHNGVRREFSDRFRGFSIFVEASNAKRFASARLAKAIGSNWRAIGLLPTLHHAEPIPGENRRLVAKELGVYEAPFAVLRGAEMPAVLLEIGVIANRQEEQDLEQVERRSAMQTEILRALDTYCPNDNSPAVRLRSPLD